jgi:hypothetical protein
MPISVEYRPYALASHWLSGSDVAAAAIPQRHAWKSAATV